MPLGSFSRGALAEAGSQDVQRMLALDETLFVEHKSLVGESSDDHQLASAVAAFANTAGGWLLLGVRNGAPVETTPAWAALDAPPLVDTIRDRLRTLLDPMPAFEARLFDLDTARIGVVRVYESADTPHVHIRSGAVYVREVAGSSDVAAPKKPGGGARAVRSYAAAQIRSRAQLVELAHRGERAGARVDALMDPRRPLPLVTDALGLKFELVAQDVMQPHAPDGASFYVRLAPYTVPARFRSWATTADAAAAALEALEGLAQVRGLDGNFVKPHPAGLWSAIGIDPGVVHASGGGTGEPATARVMIDGAGFVGAALVLHGPDDSGRRQWRRLNEIAAQFIAPTIQAAIAMLEAGEFLGRCRCQIDVVSPASAFMIEQTAGNIAFHVPVSPDLTLPAQDVDVVDLARLATYALARSAGLPAWDPPSGVH